MHTLCHIRQYYEVGVLLALQLVIHLVLDGSLQRVCKELGEAVEEQCQVV